MSVEIEVIGTSPNETALVYGPRAEILAHSMGNSGAASRHHPIGRCSDTGEILIWRDGSWRGADGGLPAASGPLSTILSGPVPSAGTRAVPSNVSGCTLEVNGSGLWEGECGYVGDYAAFAALVAANVAKFAVGTVARVANPLTARGWIEMFLAADGLLRPVVGQMIYGAYGTLLDITAAALSIGAWNLNVWQSPTLPEWIINCPSISLFALHEARDSTSSALLEQSRIGVWKANADHPATSADDCFFGHSAANANLANGRGYGSVRAGGRIVGGSIFGGGGGGVAGVTYSFPSRTIGTVNSSSSKICHDFYPGATTNTDKLFAVELWAGG